MLKYYQIWLYTTTLLRAVNIYCYLQACTQLHAYMHKHTFAHTPKHTHTHTCTRTHTHTHTVWHAYTQCMHVYARARARAHTHTHTHTHTHMQCHAHMYMYIHTHTHMCVRVHTHIHTHTHTHTHACMHERTRMHMHAHTSATMHQNIILHTERGSRRRGPTFNVERVDNVMMKKFKILMADPMLHIAFTAGEEVVNDRHLMTFHHQSVNQMRAHKARTSRHLTNRNTVKDVSRPTCPSLNILFWT